MNVSEALRAGLEAPPLPAGMTGREVIRYAGGPEAAKRLLSGMDGPVPKRVDPVAHERWRAASRRVQRWRQGTRGSKVAPLTTAERARLRADKGRRNENTMRRRGARARIYATVVVPSPSARKDDKRERELPAGGLGVPISAETMREILKAVRAGDEDLAAELFLAEFMENYGWSDFELEDVSECKIWPAGQREP